MSLEVKNISVSYGDSEILKDISFQIDKGQLIGLVAPNGTGKTTLFNAIMRFIPIKSGEILLDGEVYSASDQDVLRLHQKITFFPDQADLFKNFTGREHIKMYAQIWSGRENEIAEIINRLEMSDYVDRKVEEYSLGMKQRLCFAMMVAADTPIMLMDEVMNGLDPENVSLVSDVLIELRQENKIIIIASHLLDNLDEYADQVLFLKNKKLYQINNLNEPQALYYKVTADEKEIQELKTNNFMTENTIYLPNEILCIPIEDLTKEMEEELFTQLRIMKVSRIEIAPLGTTEHYSYIYGLSIHSFNRR